MNDRPPSGSPYPTAPTPDASYGHYAGYGQDSRIGYAGYDAYGTGTFEHVATGYGEGDPLFGSMPGAPDTSGQWDTGAQPVAGYDAYGTHQDHQQSYEQQQPYQQPYDSQQQLYDTGGYDATHYGTGSYDTTAMWGDTSAGYQPNHAQADSTGQWGTGSWNIADQYDPAQYDAAQLEQPQYEQPGFDQPAQYEQPQFEHPQPDQSQFDQSQFDQSQYGPGDGSQGVAQDSGQYSAQYQQQQYDPAGYGGPYETTTHYGSGPGFDTSGQWDASQWQQPQDGAQWDTGGFARPDEQPATGEEHSRTAHEAESERTAVFESVHEAAPEPESGSEPARSHESGMEPPETASGSRSGSHSGSRSRSAATTSPVPPSAHAPVQRRATGGGRSRRRSPAKRSALLTVAVPSVAVMGVAGIAAASVGVGDQDDSRTTQAQGESAVKPSAANNKLDTQLAGLTADADDFADRASRTQERIDLKQRQAEEKKRKEAEAARKEAERPKFALPVEQQGLSSYYGQAGVNWMSVHSGIDFPVSYGTPVMAASDGTVRTQYNIAYGNMAIVTAPDGTETWYCHLSSTKIRSGSVKAGDTIAYSGNSGNSTGPHLHFEVRPGGGSAIDPLAWLQSHGLDPQ